MTNHAQVLALAETMRDRIVEPISGPIWIGRNYYTDELLDDLREIIHLLNDEEM